MTAAFFDTNIFAYAAEANSPEPEKVSKSRSLLQSHSIVVSTQVMLELYGVLKRKLNYAPEAAYRWVSSLKDETVIVLSPDDVLSGFMLSRRYDVSHFDGMILQAANQSGVDTLYSEDLSHGQDYGGVTVINPFLETPNNP